MVAIGMMQYICLGIECPKGVILSLPEIAKWINYVVQLTVIPLKWQAFV